MPPPPGPGTETPPSSSWGNRFEALVPFRQAIRTIFGDFRKGIVEEKHLHLRHDHGSQFMSKDYQAEVKFVGVASSPAYVREPETNGCAERFVKTLKELDPRPERMIFANSGVRVTTEGSPPAGGSDLIDDLKALERSGVEILSCGTCLDYYGLVDSLRVGRASNMYEIASSLLGAERVVKL